MVGSLRTPATVAIYKDTRQNRTVSYAKAVVPWGSRLAKTLRSAVFSDELARPNKKRTAHENSTPGLFNQGTPAAKKHWKIGEMCHWHTSVSGYFYINLPSTLSTSVAEVLKSAET